MRRYALHDDQWERIKDLLPGREGHVGTNAKNNRLFVEAVLWRYRSGAPWRDLPERFGDWNNTHRRFSRWAKTGVWKRIFKHLAADPDNEYAMIDSTIVRAHQHSAGAPEKMLWGERRGQWHHRRSCESMERPMPQQNDLSRSLVVLEQDATLIAVIEMGQSSWLVAGIVPGVERSPLKKLAVDENALLKLLDRWREE